MDKVFQMTEMSIRLQICLEELAQKLSQAPSHPIPALALDQTTESLSLLLSQLISSYYLVL